MTLVLRTPFGWPVAWAEVSLLDVGERHAHDDQSGLVVSARRLGHATRNPFDDFLLCLLAGGLDARAVSEQPAGLRASQLAQAAFVESFLASDDVDVLWRLRDAVKAADAQLAAAWQKRLAATLTAVFLAGNGTAYGVSVGDSPLLVVPPLPDDGAKRRAQKLGHEPSTAVGNGETLEPASGPGGGEGIIEQWWPDLDGAGARTRLEPGTWLVLVDDGAAVWSDSDPTSGASIVVRYDGGHVSTSQLVADSGWLVSVVGYHAGPPTEARGTFGLVCLTDEHARKVVPGLVRAALELDWRDAAGRARALEDCFQVAGGDGDRTRLAVVVDGPGGVCATFASGGASVEPAMARGQAGDEHPDSSAFTLRLGSGLDPLDRGVLIEFQPHVPPRVLRPQPAERRELHRHRWPLRLSRIWRRLRGH